ncbi:MAG: sulfatase-like hydrolase/transferase [Thermodesulfovibrionales bacterium]
MIRETIKKKLFPPALATLVLPVVMANVAVSLAATFPLFRAGYAQTGPAGLLVALVPYLSNALMLNLAVGLLVSLFLLVFPERIVAGIGVLLYTLFQIVLIVDVRIYTIFRYHFNALVWNVMTTEGVSDSVELGAGTVAVFAAIVMGIAAVETAAAVAFYRGSRKSPSNGLALARVSRALFLAGVFCILLDKGMYAYADIVNNTSITKNVKLYPLYQPLTVKRLVRKVLGVEVNREKEIRVETDNRDINYPKEPIRFDPSRDRRYNIVVLAVEGLRFDMLDPEVMPNTWKFSRRNLTFRNHYSGGNGSRFGIFSLFYGIHGGYWHNFLGRRISPVMMDSLISRGYDFKVLSSTLLTFPEFRKTVFVRVPDAIEDNLQAPEMPDRDRIITDKLIAFAAAQPKDRPFFSYLFFNSSHQSYKYPPGFERFTPVVRRDEVNYFTDTDSEKIPLIRNRYKNAVHYIDSQIGRIVSALEAKGLMDRTVLLVTGDHGDEFYENGYFGHTSSFDDYQVRTVFVLHVPGERPREVGSLTSHMDFVPTVMELIGAVTPASAYSQGLSLLGSEKHDYVSSANWDTAAVIDEDVAIVYSTETYNLDLFEVRSRKDYSVVGDAKDVVRMKKAHLSDTFRRMTEFYK